MKLYDRVFLLLSEEENTRNSDKLLMWRVWQQAKTVKHNRLTFNSFMEAVTPESITRARRQVQEIYPELQATDPKVRRRRRQKEQEKGTFVFRELS